MKVLSAGANTVAACMAVLAAPVVEAVVHSLPAEPPAQEAVPTGPAPPRVPVLIAANAAPGCCLVPSASGSPVAAVCGLHCTSSALSCQKRCSAPHVVVGVLSLVVGGLAVGAPRFWVAGIHTPAGFSGGGVAAERVSALAVLGQASQVFRIGKAASAAR